MAPGVNIMVRGPSLWSWGSRTPMWKESFSKALILVFCHQPPLPSFGAFSLGLVTWSPAMFPKVPSVTAVNVQHPQGQEKWSLHLLKLGTCSFTCSDLLIPLELKRPNFSEPGARERGVLEMINVESPQQCLLQPGTAIVTINTYLAFTGLSLRLQLLDGFPPPLENKEVPY